MMNYAEQTYEKILGRCLDRVGSDVDKREGSVIYDALAPAAAELAEFYSVLSAELDRAFPDTAGGIDLTNKAKERRIMRLEATRAVRRAVLKAENGEAAQAPEGARFSGGSLNYVVIGRLEDGAYQVRAEEAGSAGNAYFGPLLPIDYLPGLVSAELAEVLIPGEDEETDDALRSRYQESLQRESYGWNLAGYQDFLRKQPGVGEAKVFPVWNGGGTVKVAITDAEGGVPSATLVRQVQEALDPPGYAGEGVGAAAIGHTVTVAAAVGVTVAVSLTPVFDTGYTWEGVKASVQAALESYFADLTADWAAQDHIIIRLSQVNSRVLAVNGILDVNGAKLNGVAENLKLNPEEIPLLGEVSHAPA